MRKPPDFSLVTIRTLAKRAGEVCSKPNCNQGTGGPHTDVAKSTNLGEAAHIRGARSQPNNRFDPSMTNEERAHITNGIWLCSLHAKEIDTDEKRFTVELLLKWKEEHELAVRDGRATRGAPPPVVHELRFFLLQYRKVLQLSDGSEAFEIEFLLENKTTPPQEVHNIFGNLWIDGAHFITSTFPPTTGHLGAPRVVWAIQTSVLPKESFFETTKLLVRMPKPGEEVHVGAVFVSKETEKQDYFWHIVNDEGLPKTVVIKHPHDLK